MLAAVVIYKVLLRMLTLIMYNIGYTIIYIHRIIYTFATEMLKLIITQIKFWWYIFREKYNF